MIRIVFSLPMSLSLVGRISPTAVRKKGAAGKRDRSEKTVKDIQWRFFARYERVNGTVPRDFDFRFSTWISFFQAEIFTAEGAPLVSLTPVANGKNLQSEKFSLYLLDTSSSF